MKDARRTREQLVSELTEMRQRIVELETSEAERLSAEQGASGRRRVKKWNGNRWTNRCVT
jgi:hypothetical protein